MPTFSDNIITWQKTSGRHNLPWQNTTDPYAIWVSEIMLQQTQVSAVIGYYEKFMRRFPDIATLAQAKQEEVLRYWSGLGYYARARHLHQATLTIMHLHDGVFPQTFASIQALTGIGRSTAAAIAVFAFNQRQAILDGNVKRILTRYFLIEGWPGEPKIERQLWQHAENLLPTQEIIAYTQGLMDLGSSLCTKTKAQCSHCPLQETCGAHQQQRTHHLPASKPKKPIPEKHITMLLLLRGNNILLERKPTTGIWGGLWSLPEITPQNESTITVPPHLGVQAEALPAMPTFIHKLTHFKLFLHPQPMQVNACSAPAESTHLTWLSLEQAIHAAIPSPVRKILLDYNTYRF